MTLQSSLQSLVYVKQQAAVGTGATITQADLALRVRSCEFAAQEGTILRDGSQSATGLPALAVMGGRNWMVTMQVELMRFADYTDVDSNPLSALLAGTGALTATTYNPGGGSANAINLRFSAAYNPPTAPVPFTIEKHEIGGNRSRATDCYAVITGIAADGQKEFLVDIQVMGLWSTPVASTFTAAAADYGASQALQTPTIFTGASLVSGIRRSNGVTEQTFTGLQSVGITPAMQLVARPSVLSSAVAGFAPAFLTRTGSSDTVAFSVDLHPEGDTTDDISAWANWIAQAEGRDLRLISNEGSGGMKVVVAMVEVQYNDAPVSSTAQAFRQYDLVAAGKDPNTGATYGGLDIYFLAGT
jgi:hypothetical protein